jgi:hypothetical protein
MPARNAAALPSRRSSRPALVPVAIARDGRYAIDVGDRSGRARDLGRVLLARGGWIVAAGVPAVAAVRVEATLVADDYTLWVYRRDRGMPVPTVAVAGPLPPAT